MSRSVNIADRVVGRIGLGTMTMSWRPQPPPAEASFKTMKTALANGVSFWNAGEFYGGLHNLQLLNKYFTEHPDDRKDVFLSVKGGFKKNMSLAASLDELRASAENINKVLGSPMDLFEPARVNPRIPREQIGEWLKILKDEGHFKYVGLSEVSLETLKKVNSVVRVDAVELEVSPATTDVLLDGTLAYCEENKIPIVAYSPLTKGLFTDSKLKIVKGDMRQAFDRFQPQNLEHNLAVVQKWREVAHAKGASLPALVIAWLLAQSPVLLPLPGSSRAEGLMDALGAHHVELTSQELEQLNSLAFSEEFQGSRYNKQMNAMTRL